MQMSMTGLHREQPPVPVHQHPILKDDKLHTYERALAFSQLALHSQISHRNVAIYDNQFIHQIYTIDDTTLPHLVFLHGYGGTSMTAVRIFRQLYGHFQVHALDAFGIGYSSRGNFSEQFTFEQTRDYYIEAVEEWRKAAGIQKFYLVGHSFGGYLAASYALKYPERVQRLILVSPAGTSAPNIDEQEMTCRRKLFMGLAKRIYGCNIRPSAAMSNFIIGNRMVDSILRNRLKLPEDELAIWKEYMGHFNSQETSSEVGFYKLFDWPLVPKVTIEEIIESNKFPFQIDFYFGDQDWMERQGAVRLAKKYDHVSLRIIPNAGHQIVFDNPQELCLKITASRARRGHMLEEEMVRRVV